MWLPLNIISIIIKNYNHIHRNSSHNNQLMFKTAINKYLWNSCKIVIIKDSCFYEKRNSRIRPCPRNKCRAQLNLFYNSKHEKYSLKHIYELKDKSSMFLKSIQRSFKYSQSLSYHHNHTKIIRCIYSTNNLIVYVFTATYIYVYAQY